MTDISVIIPLGPGHELLVHKAINSVLMQVGPVVETIVINDTPNTLDLSMYPVKVLSGGGKGPAHARNLGADASTGEALVWLDADDLLCPGALKALWDTYRETGTIVYGSLIRSDLMEIHKSPEQYCGEDIKKTALYVPKRMPTHLVPRTAHYAIGGWDTEALLWEDVIYEISMDIAGYCATQIDYPIYFYNWDSGTRRISDLADQAKHYIKIKFDDYFKGKKKMGCSGCGGTKNAVPRFTTTIQDNNMLNLFNTKILELEYTGEDPSVRSYPGPVTGRQYRFGATKVERTRKIRIGFEEGQVHPDDAKEMARLSDKNNGKQFKVNVIGDKTPLVQRSEPVKRPGVQKDLKMKMPAEEVLAMKNAIWAGMAIEQFTVKELREAIDSVPNATLTRWLQEEQGAENPRVTVINLLESKLEVADDSAA